jgi:23S rRNA (cytidine2498-2'-O)-methyltransferase
MPSTYSALLAYTRPGFESECAQELQAWAATRDATGYAKADRDAAHVQFVATTGNLPEPTWRELVFARQVLRVVAEIPDLEPKDRLAPILESVAGQRFADVWVETPDSAAGAEIKGLARSFEPVLVAALRKRGALDAEAPRRLHVCFLSGTRAIVASADVARAAPWPLGIPRLKLPREAPSRSALKIEEAWLTLMSEAERGRWLAPGLTAVDLGAAPGGWTWQLARKSLRVVAVDNGPLREHVLDTGLVEHVRADGFRYRPKKGVDWVVCDMVEQPSRVAALMAAWLAEGHARAALFNLKLPMKKRWQETRLCLDGLRDSLAGATPRGARSGSTWDLRAKQLYHDREEITVVALPG